MAELSPAVRTLLQRPLSRATDLGRPIPEAEHATSVCLPTWADVVAYEQADPRVLGALRSGYPRFVLNPSVQRLFAECQHRFAASDELCQVYPTHSAARRCLAFVGQGEITSDRIVALDDGEAHGVCFPASLGGRARKYWQHTGEGISSRRAAALLQGMRPVETTRTKTMIRQRLADTAGARRQDVLLFPTGMAAAAAVYRACHKVHPQRQSVQLGPAYVDLIKLQTDLGTGARLYASGDADALETLARQLATQQILGLFVEMPSNPLLYSTNLASVSALAQRHGFPLIVDDTIGTSVNLALLEHVDVLITSLTKFFSGSGEVMGGSVTFNPHRAAAQAVAAVLLEEYEDSLWWEDAVVLETSSRSFRQRVQRISASTAEVCEYLAHHPLVERLYYPSDPSCGCYREYARQDAGYGGLCSIVLKDPATTTPVFYDNLEISKGPSLGTSFSLCCPYTMLAHFNELTLAEELGMSRYLLRFSFGLEGSAELIRRLEAAFSSV